MKYLYNVIAMSSALPDTKDEFPKETYLGVYENATIVETGVTAFLFNQIPEDEWHVNNSVIVPPISDSLFVDETQVELPAAAAIWNPAINFWSYKNYIIRINQIPLLVSSQDVTNFICPLLNVSK